MLNIILWPSLEVTFWLWLAVLALTISLNWLRLLISKKTNVSENSKLASSIRLLFISFLLTLLILFAVTSTSRALDVQGAEGAALKVKVASWLGVDGDSFPLSVNTVPFTPEQDKSAPLKKKVKRSLTYEKQRRLTTTDLGSDEYLVNYCLHSDDCRQYVVVTDDPETAFNQGYVKLSEREYRKVNK